MTMLKPTGTRIADGAGNLKAMTARLVSNLDAPLALDDHIPLPPKGGRTRTGDHLKVQHTLERMGVGQSFVSPLKEQATLTIMKGVSERHGRKFATRRMEHKQVRVWRVE
jgi:hypothetical protein